MPAIRAGASRPDPASADDPAASRITPPALVLLSSSRLRYSLSVPLKPSTCTLQPLGFHHRGARQSLIDLRIRRLVYAEANSRIHPCAYRRLCRRIAGKKDEHPLVLFSFVPAAVLIFDF